MKNIVVKLNADIQIFIGRRFTGCVLIIYIFFTPSQNSSFVQTLCDSLLFGTLVNIVVCRKKPVSRLFTIMLNKNNLFLFIHIFLILEKFWCTQKDIFVVLTKLLFFSPIC